MLCREAEFLKLKMPTKKVSDDASAPKGSLGLCVREAGRRTTSGGSGLLGKSPRELQLPTHPGRAGEFQGPLGGRRLQSGSHGDGIGARELLINTNTGKLPAPLFLCSVFQLVHQTHFI